MRAVWLFVATAAFSGYAPFAPGTVGSAVGVLVYWACRPAQSLGLDVAVIAVLAVLGARAGTEAEQHFGREDPGHVVIDEVVGMLITLVALPVSWTGILVGFIAFRVFDVVKPWPASRLERLARRHRHHGRRHRGGRLRASRPARDRRAVARLGLSRMSATGSVRPVSVAAIIAVGSELLRHDRTDTNSLYITARLEELGIAVVLKAVVGDSLSDLTDAVRFAHSRADVVVLTGGLGPTDDDLTRDAVAAALGRAMSHDEATIDAIRARFARRQMVMPAINRRQGLVIDGARLLRNENGTAPGQWIDDDHRIVLLLPGPPREMRPMMDAVAAGSLAERVGKERLFRRSVRIAGRSESHAEELLQPLYAQWARLPVPIAATILAALGLIELQLTARMPDAAHATALLDDAVRDVVSAFGPDAFSTDGSTLDVVVGRLLTERGLRVAFAESCTGGLVSARLSDVAGCSAYFERAVVTYSNAAKRELLGVPGETIDEHGAVSEPVARGDGRGHPSARRGRCRRVGHRHRRALGRVGRQACRHRGHCRERPRRRHARPDVAVPRQPRPGQDARGASGARPPASRVDWIGPCDAPCAPAASNQESSEPMRPRALRCGR